MNAFSKIEADVAWSTPDAKAKFAAVSRLAKAGHSATQIAVAFAVTRNTVIGFCRRNGIQLLGRRGPSASTVRRPARPSAPAVDLRPIWEQMSVEHKTRIIAPRVAAGESMVSIGRQFRFADGKPVSGGAVSWFCNANGIKILVRNCGKNSVRLVGPSREQKVNNAALAATSFNDNGEGIGFMGLSATSCKQPLFGWDGAPDPAMADKLYCGAPVDAGSRHCYCAAHRALNCVSPTDEGRVGLSRVASSWGLRGTVRRGGAF